VTRVVWTEHALGQIEAIRDYIATVSPVYADAMVDRIMARQAQLARFPESGHRSTEAADPTIRELIEWPYRIIYRLQPSLVEVLAVVHGRRQDLRTLPT